MLSNAPITILHLSDLHFGENSRFYGLEPEEIGHRFASAVGSALMDRGFDRPVDLVINTGDISEKCLPAEYSQATAFFETLCTDLNVDRRQFVFVAGNHDVSWIECKRAELEIEEQGLPKERLRELINSQKFQPFDRFLTQFQGQPRDKLGVLLPKGGFVQTFEGVGVSVACLNTCENESHLPQDHLGMLSDVQSQGLMDYWKNEAANSLIRIVAVHHNPTPTIPPSVAQWLDFLQKEATAGRLDKTVLARFASDIVGFEGRDMLHAIAEDSKVSLVLHGHDHASDVNVLPWRRGERGATHVLAAGSWGLAASRLPQFQPNTAQLITLNPDKHEIKAWRLVYEPADRPKGKVSLGNFVDDKRSSKMYCQELYVPSLATTTTTTTTTPLRDEVSFQTRLPARFYPMPLSRQSITHTFEVGGHLGHMTVGLYEDGTPGELFINIAKEGSTVGGIFDAFATIFSLLLQCGYPINEITERLQHMRFEPSGFTKNPEIPYAKSIVDYIARWLNTTFPLKEDERGGAALRIKNKGRVSTSDK